MPSRPTSAKHLQLKFQAFLFTGPARCFLPRSAVNGALEAHVAKATITALGDGNNLAGSQQLIQHLTGFSIRDDGANRHLQGDVVAGCTKHVGAHAVLATLGVMSAGETKIDQGIQIGVRHGKHMTAATTVAAVGTAKLFVLFMPKRDAAGSTISAEMSI
jgi:hypothetical protein